MTPEPPRTGLIRLADVRDPRLGIDEGALVLASRNAYPVVARQPGRRSDGGLALGAAIALLLGGATFWSLSGHRHAPPPAPAQVAVASPLRPVTPQPRLLPQVAPAPPPGLLLPHVVQPLPVTALPGADAAHAPLITYDASGTPRESVLAPTAPTTAPRIRTEASPFIPNSGNDNDQFAARVGGTGDVASARRLSDPATTITQGTLIPAVLETAIDTDLPGYVRALVAEDVRSFDGSRVLVPRSSRLIGQYKSGLAAGQTRAYVIWTRLIRPDGVSVSLGSPAIDFAGRSGLGGQVDSHFLKRFGSAALLSVVGGLTAVGNASVVLSGGQSAASVAAQRDTQIPPTIKVPQGQPIRVFTAKDLDFSSAGGDAQ